MQWFELSPSSQAEVTSFPTAAPSLHYRSRLALRNLTLSASAASLCLPVSPVDADSPAPISATLFLIDEASWAALTAEADGGCQGRTAAVLGAMTLPRGLQGVGTDCARLALGLSDESLSTFRVTVPFSSVSQTSKLFAACVTTSSSPAARPATASALSTNLRVSSNSCAALAAAFASLSTDRFALQSIGDILLPLPYSLNSPEIWSAPEF